MRVLPPGGRVHVRVASSTTAASSPLRRTADDLPRVRGLTGARSALPGAGASAPVYAKPGDAGPTRRDRGPRAGAGSAPWWGPGCASTPDGYVGLVHPRSGLAARHGINIVNTRDHRRIPGDLVNLVNLGTGGGPAPPVTGSPNCSSCRSLRRVRRGGFASGVNGATLTWFEWWLRVHRLSRPDHRTCRYDLRTEHIVRLFGHETHARPGQAAVTAEVDAEGTDDAGAQAWLEGRRHADDSVSRLDLGSLRVRGARDGLPRGRRTANGSSAPTRPRCRRCRSRPSPHQPALGRDRTRSPRASPPAAAPQRTSTALGTELRTDAHFRQPHRLHAGTFRRQTVALVPACRHVRARRDRRCRRRAVLRPADDIVVVRNECRWPQEVLALEPAQDRNSIR